MSQNCQHLPPELQTFYSSNLAESELCFRHVQQGQVIGPLFRCESCGSSFCPVCATGVWERIEAGKHRYAWYRCPICTNGFAFIALPLGEPIPCPPTNFAESRIMISVDPVLQQTWPGAYRVLFWNLVRRGSYQAFWADGGQSLLRLDGWQWVSWVQRADSVDLTVMLAALSETLMPLDEGEYLLLIPPNDSTGEPTHPVFFLELPQGYQEYAMPQGWPGPDAPRRLRVTERIWNQSQLTKVLPTLFGAADGVGGMPTLAQFQRRAA